MLLLDLLGLATALAATMLGEPEQPSATLLFAGDAMMHQAQIDAAARQTGEYDYSECFEALAPTISSADLAVVNLETPLGGKPYSGYPCFCAPDSYAQALLDAGFDLFLTANNHTLDRRDKGLVRTVDVLNSLGVSHLGTYRNVEQRDSILPLICDVKGIKIGFLNYTYGTNGIVPQGQVVVDYIDRNQIKKDIEDARQGGAELVCVAVHWGDEYKLLPNAAQKSLAEFLLAEGVDIVMGGHPHVIQPMEIRERPDGSQQLLVYSLGNFISNMKTRDTRGGALSEVYISRDTNGKAQVDSAAYRLVFTIPGTRVGHNFRVVDADSVDSGQWRMHCRQFVDAATAIFNKHNISVPRK